MIYIYLFLLLISSVACESDKEQIIKKMLVNEGRPSIAMLKQKGYKHPSFKMSNSGKEVGIDTHEELSKESRRLLNVLFTSDTLGIMDYYILSNFDAQFNKEEDRYITSRSTIVSGLSDSLEVTEFIENLGGKVSSDWVKEDNITRFKIVNVQNPSSQFDGLVHIQNLEGEENWTLYIETKYGEK